MKLRTKIKTKEVSHPIDHGSKLVLLGSCFSEHMQEKFAYYKFHHCTNPYGILFHPIAIERALKECLEFKTYKKDDLHLENGTWLSYHHHSKFNDRDFRQVLKRINDNIVQTGEMLKKASHLIITLGTSWVYRKKKDNQIVANCHKLPADHFTKELLSIDEINSSLLHMIHTIQSYNKKARILFTLSPVRHLKDGIEENALSKARLLQAIHEVKDEKFAFYFPSYEIMMDDLRDYRFYNKDLLHPNEIAIEYVWDLFIHTWMNKNTRSILKEIEKIQKSLHHRAFDPESAQHRLFLEKLKNRIDSLQNLHPEIQF